MDAGCYIVQALRGILGKGRQVLDAVATSDKVDPRVDTRMRAVSIGQQCGHPDLDDSAGIDAWVLAGSHPHEPDRLLPQHAHRGEADDRGQIATRSAPPRNHRTTQPPGRR